jgi:hypothetical protein
MGSWGAEGGVVDIFSPVYNNIEDAGGSIAAGGMGGGNAVIF